ncbi:MAG: Bug family tripartite tricarboxylate transporter substrate binding protein [Burkholderiales bacterium]
MLTLRIALPICLLALLTPGAHAATAQNFPTRPIRIVTSEIGGGLDFLARLVAQGLTPNLGQQVIIDNRPSGVFTGSIVSKASPDGYTLLCNGSSFWLLPFLQSNVPYDPVKDFSPITLATSSPLMLVVHPALPVKSVKELIALAKAKPGELNYSSSSPGTPQHIAAELFKSMTGVNIVRIPYKGAGPAVVALVAGEVQMTFSSAGAAVPHIKSGRLRALAIASAEPSALAPGLPTVASAGLPGFEAGSLWGFFAPAKTPVNLINRLQHEIVSVLNKADMKEKLFNATTEVVGSSPEKFAAVINADMQRGRKVIEAAGIRAE